MSVPSRHRCAALPPGIVELHSTPPAARPAEEDDCKSSIPGDRAVPLDRSAASGHPFEPADAKSQTSCPTRIKTSTPSLFSQAEARVQSALPPGMVELHSTPPAARPAEKAGCKSSNPGDRAVPPDRSGASGHPFEKSRREVSDFMPDPY
jgi:hypothetical protein